MKLLALIPHYRHTDTLPTVVAALRAHNLPVLIVDDGSGEDCRIALEKLAGQEGVSVFYKQSNGGKGSAVKAGIRLAHERGYSHILQIDADAQHAFDDIPKLADMAFRRPESMVCGRPVYGGDAPKSRLYGRKITDFWNAVNTLSSDIRDGMCGFRVYPVAHVLPLLDASGDRMDFDNEILVRLHWRHVPFIWIDTPVRYEPQGVSHFLAFRDNWLISKMHARLFFGMLRQVFTGKRP